VPKTGRQKFQSVSTEERWQHFGRQFKSAQLRRFQFGSIRHIDLISLVFSAPATAFENGGRIAHRSAGESPDGSVAHLSREWNEGQDGIAGHAGE
jgi:hypothetical protein